MVHLVVSLSWPVSRKNIAQRDYDEKPPPLRDTLPRRSMCQLSTIRRQTAWPLLATNSDLLEAASAAIDASKTVADAKYGELDTLLAEVKAQVEAGLVSTRQSCSSTLPTL